MIIINQVNISRNWMKVAYTVEFKLKFKFKWLNQKEIDKCDKM